MSANTVNGGASMRTAFLCLILGVFPFEALGQAYSNPFLIDVGDFRNPVSTVGDACGLDGRKVGFNAGPVNGLAGSVVMKTFSTFANCGVGSDCLLSSVALLCRSPECSRPYASGGNIAWTDFYLTTYWPGLPWATAGYLFLDESVVGGPPEISDSFGVFDGRGARNWSGAAFVGVSGSSAQTDVYYSVGVSFVPLTATSDVDERRPAMTANDPLATGIPGTFLIAYEEQAHPTPANPNPAPVINVANDLWSWSPSSSPWVAPARPDIAGEIVCWEDEDSLLTGVRTIYCMDVTTSFLWENVSARCVDGYWGPRIDDSGRFVVFAGHSCSFYGDSELLVWDLVTGDTYTIAVDIAPSFVTTVSLGYELYDVNQGLVVYLRKLESGLAEMWGHYLPQ